MAQTYAKPWIRTSVNVSPQFHRLCREHRIRFSDAMKIGISIILAERGIMEYNNDLNIVRKRTLMAKQIQDMADEIAKLKNEVE